MFIPSARYLRVLVPLAAALFIQTASATYFNITGAQQIVFPGSTAIISLNPVLPKRGEPFTINVTGQWKDKCIPFQETVSIHPLNDHFHPGLISILATPDHTNDCGDGFEPTAYFLSVQVQGSDWELFFNEQRVNDQKPVSVVFTVQDPLVGEDLRGQTAWAMSFDLNYGLHTISPRLKSGYWVSTGTPYQGLLIQQQGDTVVFYDLKYNRVSGEPNWHYADGRFDGNSLNGVAYLVNWLSPVDGINPAYTSFILPPINKLVQPKPEDLLFEPSSAGLRVLGVNRIQAFVGLIDGVKPVEYAYKPWVFALDANQLPPVVPDMTGPWVLYGLNGQTLEQSYQMEFKAGIHVEGGLYRFTSLDDEWLVDCQVNLDGEGSCQLRSEGLGLVMDYELNCPKSYEWWNPSFATDFEDSCGYFGADGNYENAAFNGNYAKAPLVNSNDERIGQTGILLRSGLHLPVLDLQN